MFENTNYRRVAGLAGVLTQSGAVIKSAKADAKIAAGLPVKYEGGKVVELAGGEAASDVFGIVLRPTTPFEPFYPGDLIEVVHEGFIQVPMTDEETPVRGGAVYFDHATKLFTTQHEGKVPVRAIFAADGMRDGVAEIQIFPHLPVAA